MAFDLFSDVILTTDVPAEDLRAGDVGTVVEHHAPDGYSVEFFDMTGQTITVATLPASALRLPTQADRPAVRALAGAA